MKRIMIGLVLLIALGAGIYYLLYPKTMTEKWQRDIEYLTRQLPKKHSDLFHSLTQEEFHQRMFDLKNNVPHMDNDEIIVCLKEIFTLTGDAHLMVVNFESDIQKVFGMQTFMNIFLESDNGILFPIKTKWFGDDLHIVEIGSAYADVLGSRVIEVNGVPIGDVMEKINTLIPHNNQYRLKSYNAMYLVKPSVAKHFGLSDGKTLSFTLEKENGERDQILIPAEKYDENRFSRLPADTDYPLYQKRKDLFWYEYFPGNDTVYFRLTAYADKKSNVQKRFHDSGNSEVVLPDLDDFLIQLGAFMEENPVEKLILDLRDNNGGSYDVADRLFDFIEKNEKINVRGKLFLIVNNGCFSMPVYDSVRYKEGTNALIYGEPTGEMPFNGGGANIMILPYTRNRVLYTAKTFQPIDERDAFTPDVLVYTTFEEYKNGIDAPLEKIMTGE